MQKIDYKVTIEDYKSLKNTLKYLRWVKRDITYHEDILGAEWEIEKFIERIKKHKLINFTMKNKPISSKVLEDKLKKVIEENVRLQRELACVRALLKTKKIKVEKYELGKEEK